MSTGLFLVLWCVTCGTIGLIVLCICHYDYIVVGLMRLFNLPFYPAAVGIAITILRHPEEWSSSKHMMTHPEIGSIWIANGAYGLHVDTDFGQWTPNKIERRIIREAVDWRLSEYIKGRVTQAMQRA